MGLESERPRVTGKARRVKQLPACGGSTSMRVSDFRVCKKKLQLSHERKRALHGWNETSRSLVENSGPVDVRVGGNSDLAPQSRRKRGGNPAQGL